MKRIALIHTVKSVLNSFEGLLREAMGDELLISNTLDDFLASDAAVRGEFSVDNQNRLFYLLKAEELTGADLIVVTCSTLTPTVTALRGLIKTPVIAIDDAMTRLAVQSGEKITIMATAQSTVEPTRQKLLHDAAQIDKVVSISVIVREEALTALKAGDSDTHDRLVKQAALDIKNQDVIILAQASMGHLEEDIKRICGCTVLSSPRLCVAQVKEFLSK